ncbi:MAG: hypothetical protein QRY71_01520 [Candidatus Rhabdochlamydia sp.]
MTIRAGLSFEKSNYSSQESPLHSPSLDRTQQIHEQGIQSIALLTSNSSVKTQSLSSPHITVYEPFALDHLMLQPHLRLEEIYAISKTTWIQWIKNHPTQEMLYCHLARRLELEETAQLDQDQLLSAKSLFLKALELAPHNPHIYFYFADKMHHLYLHHHLEMSKKRENLSRSTDIFNGSDYENAKELYKKALFYDPLYFAALIGLADLLQEKDTVQLEDQTDLTSTHLCLQVIRQDPLYGDSYRCLADLSQKHPACLQFLGLTIKELYLKALHLNPDDPRGYISLYQAWDLIQHSQDKEKIFIIINQKRFRKETLLIKAVSLSCHDPYLKRMYQTHSLITDPCFPSFLKKIDYFPFPSHAKLDIYHSFLHQLLIRPLHIPLLAENLMNLIAKERGPQKPVLNEEVVFRQSIALYEQIQSFMTVSKNLSPAESLNGAIEHLLHHQEHTLYVAQLLAESIASPLNFHVILSLFTRAMCENPYNGQAYASCINFIRLCPFLNASPSPTFVDEFRSFYLKGIHNDSPPDFMDKFKSFYLMSIHIDPLNFDAYHGLYTLDLPYPITLMNQQVLSHEALVIKIIASSCHLNRFFLNPIKPLNMLSLLNAFHEEHQIHPLNSYQITTIYQFLFQNEFKNNLYWKYELFEYNMRDDDLFFSSEQAINNINKLIPLLKPLYQQLKGKEFSLHTLETLDYPDLRMIHPESSLDELFLVSWETWMHTLEKNPLISYFYCNLARVCSEAIKENRKPLDLVYKILQKHAEMCTPSYLKNSKNAFLSSDNPKFVQLFIFNLYFRALKLDPLNFYAYRHFIDSLLINDSVNLIPIFYSIAFHIAPENVINILNLMRLPIDQIAQNSFLSQQHLFHQALALDLYHQLTNRITPYLAVKIEKAIVNHTPLYLELLHQHRINHPYVLYQEIQNTIFDLVKKIASCFPQQVLYFRLSHETYPYLQYDSAQAQFSLGYYELDSLLGVFSLITNNLVPLNLRNITEFLQGTESPISKIPLAIELIKRGILPRHLKVKLFDLIIQVCQSIKPGMCCSVGEFYTQIYRRSFFQLRPGEEIGNYQYIRSFYNFIPKNFSKNKNSYIANDYFCGNSSDYILWGISKMRLKLNQHQELFTMNLDEGDIEHLYLKLAAVLNPEESLYIIRQGEEVVPSICHIDSAHPFLPRVKALSKQDLYLEALFLNPYNKEPFIGLESLPESCYHFQTDRLLSDDQIYHQFFKILPETFNPRLKHYSGRDRLLSNDYVWQGIQTAGRLDQIMHYTFTSLKDLYIYLIDSQLNSPYPYAFLGNRLKDGETVQFIRAGSLSKTQLYQRAVQLEIDDPSIYYRLASRLSSKQGTPLFDGKTLLSKADLFMAAFLLDPTSSFYLKEWIGYLKYHQPKLLPP